MALLDNCSLLCSRASNVRCHMASILCLAYLHITAVTLETGQPMHPARVRPVFHICTSVFFMPLSLTIGTERHCVFWLYIRPSVVHPYANMYFAWCDISVGLLNGGISMKLASDIRNVNGSCWKGFQDQRSVVSYLSLKFEIIVRWNGLFWQRDTDGLTAIHPLSVRWRHTKRWCGINADLLVVSSL